jgi:uncharacterized membrane protein
LHPTASRAPDSSCNAGVVQTCLTGPDVGQEAIGRYLRIVGLGIEVAAVAIIVGGLAWSSYVYLTRRMAGPQYEAYKIRIGRSLLLGLEVVVAADIVKTIAVAPTLPSLAVLAGLVLIRTFLSWMLVLDIEGRWPWQREAPPARDRKEV